MRPRRYWLPVALVVAAMAGQTRAQQAFRWEQDLPTAQRIASQTNRLVLIHLWAPWCGACKRMDRDVFERPDVAAAIAAGYVPVKLNADYSRPVGVQYGVTALPTVVITTPDGRRVESIQGAVEASAFLSNLNRIASTARGPAVPGQSPYAAVANAGQIAPQMPPAIGPMGMSAPPIAPAPAANPAVVSTIVPPPPAAPSGSVATAAPPMTADGNFPLGLEGYCPVQLTENRRWVVGDRRWGVNHEGRLYLFAGPDEQKRFLENPRVYGPVMSGNDVVVVLDKGQTVGGRREHGVFFGQRIYLFSSEESLQEFSKRPNYYANAILHTQQAAQQWQMYR